MSKETSKKRKIRFRASKKVNISAKENGKIMLWQVKKILNCHFPDLSSRLSSLNNPREDIRYTLEELVMAAITLFLRLVSLRRSLSLSKRRIIEVSPFFPSSFKNFLPKFFVL